MRLEQLVLIRLASSKSVKPSDLDAQLQLLTGIRDFKPKLDAVVAALVADGSVLRRPLRVTERGRTLAAEALGVGAVPDWRKVRSRYLPALALGFTPAAVDDVKTAVLARLLVRLLGPFPDADDPKGIIKHAIKTETEAEEATANALVPALVRRWVGEQPRPPSPPAKKPWNDHDVIAAVRDATAHVPATGRFGGDRVFVSAIWRQLGEGAAFPGLTLDDLKKKLVAANRDQQLTLARADLVGAMDPREVAASEIRYLNSTFHFVLDRSRA